VVLCNSRDKAHPPGDTWFKLEERSLWIRYGGKGANGGGDFSGKDPSKVDRSAAYAAKACRKNLVAGRCFAE